MRCVSGWTLRPSVGPTGQKNVERHREGMRVETSLGPLGPAFAEEKATEAVLDFLQDRKVGCMVTLRPRGG